MEHVYNIVSVELALLKSFPPQLLITSVGTVRSGGWKNGTLDLVQYIVPPADGIQEINFLAEPPQGSAIDVLLPIPALTVISDIPEWLKGVRVISATNKLEALLGDAKSVPLNS